MAKKDEKGKEGATDKKVDDNISKYLLISNWSLIYWKVAKDPN